MEKSKRRVEWLEKAGILTEALPYMRRYSGKAITVKYGGHAMGDATLSKKFASDIVLLKQVVLIPSWCMVAGRRSAPCWNGWKRNPNLLTAFG